MSAARKSGGLTRAVPSQEVGRCGLPEHEGYGALCLGCAIALGREERAYEREECAKLAENLGLVTARHVAQLIRERTQAEKDEEKSERGQATLPALLAGLALAGLSLLAIGWVGDHMATTARMLAKVTHATRTVLQGG